MSYGGREAVTGAEVEYHRGAAFPVVAWDEPCAWANTDHAITLEGERP